MPLNCIATHYRLNLAIEIDSCCSEVGSLKFLKEANSLHKALHFEVNVEVYVFE